MIRILFKKLLDEKSFQVGRRVTVGEVSEETGISRATLTRISNNPGYNTNTDTIDLLCDYFKCKPGELLEHHPKQAQKQDNYGKQGMESNGH